MCFICENIETKRVTPYDAGIWAIEMKSFIGDEHSKVIIKAVNKYFEPDICIDYDSESYIDLGGYCISED